MSSGVAVYEAVDNGGDFIFRDFNTAAEKIEKVSRKDILGKRVSEAFPGVKAFGVFQVFKRVWQTGKPEFYPENIYKNERSIGSWRESWVFKLPTGEIVAIYNDITARKQAEVEMQLKNEELIKLNAEKDKFFSIIAHDLRSPFHTLLGFTRLMLEDLPTLTLDEIQKIAVNMRNSANKLFSLLDNLLEWSQMQRGLGSFKPESFILVNGIIPIIELIRDAANKKMIGISYDLPEDLRVMADEHWF
ncbi:MAG: hypothetical protein NTV01_12855 [Bacteroidia bacterium]|nr:hypothetical protein [Bacteroidia bacterium]